MTKLPKKISPCPIIESTIELKFSPIVPQSAILGIVYTFFREKYPKIDNLPASQVSEDIKLRDPSFKYKAYNRLSNSKFSINVGYNVISLNCGSDYLGWTDFFEEIKYFLQKVDESKIVGVAENIILRYLNFFDVDIFKHINFEMRLMESIVNSNSTTFRVEIPKNEYIQVLQIANNVEYSKNNKTSIGSLVDVAIAYTPVQNIFTNIDTAITKIHDFEKELFFGLLKENFVKTLNPIY